MTDPTSPPDWAHPELCRSLPRLLRTGETNTAEFMESYPEQARNIGKEIAALAPTGGLVLVGVTDDGEMKGLGSCETASGRDAWIRRVEGLASGNLIAPTVKFDAHFGVLDGKVCLALEIPRHSQPIYYCGNVPYIRNQRESRPATPDEVIDRIRRWLGYEEVVPEVEDEGQAFAALNHTLTDISVHADLMSEDERFLNPWLDEFSSRCDWWAKELRQHSRDLASHPLLAEEILTLAKACEDLTLRWMRKQYEEEPVRAIREAVLRLKEQTLDGHPLSLGAAASAKEQLERASSALGDIAEQAEKRGGLRITETQEDAANLGIEAYRIAQYPLPFLDTDGLAKLRAVLRRLALISTIRLYIDGGASLARIQKTIEETNTELRAIVASIP